MPGQTVDELIRIQMEVTAGWEWGDPRSKVADTPDNREAWDEIGAEIRQMQADGLVPDLPHEVDIDPPAPSD